MPVYKNEKTGKWYCIYRIKDASGNSKQVKKSGFTLKREAEAYEHDQLANASYQPDMSFSDFVELYNNTVDKRLREHTIQTRNYRIKNRIIPYFADMRLRDIDAKAIATWHNELISKGLSAGYIRNLHRNLSAIFIHATRFYGLRDNPCHKAGLPSVANEQKKEMRFWTLEEYQTAIECVTDLKAKAAIALLYWSGMRKGELLALTWGKLNTKEGTIKIDRSFQRLKGRDVVTPTKTGSIRTIIFPEQALDLLAEYKSHCFDTGPADVIFPWEKCFIEHGIAEVCQASGVRRIHVHGLRHSHASLLIQQGVNIVLISKRLGHAKVSMTLDTYSHFFPTEENDVVAKLSMLG